jgi:CDP-diacylglycerol---glycerol-3-phosphate 3-phosphatidyltransferase
VNQGIYVNIPNILTTCRLVLILVIVCLFYIPSFWAYITVVVLFAIASITDWLDGYLARSLDQKTPLGAFLDPVADKLIVCAILCLLIEQYSNWWITIPAMLLISREIIISALREWMAELGQRANVAVSSLGKLKTTIQMFAILSLLMVKPFSSIFLYLGLPLLYISVGLSLMSMLNYLNAAKKHLL